MALCSTMAKGTSNILDPGVNQKSRKLSETRNAFACKHPHLRDVRINYIESNMTHYTNSSIQLLHRVRISVNKVSSEVLKQLKH